MDAILHTLSNPDYLPVAFLLPILAFLLAVWWREARANDRLLARGRLDLVARRMRRGGDVPEGDEEEPPVEVSTWPHLVRIEAIAAIVALALLTVWSILVDAPLEGPASLNQTPDPAKAPWYFLGLQELLVYFDPWIAGVIVPLLIVAGLALIPYLDPNPRGNGCYTWRQRRLAIGIFLFGFLGLWLLPLLVGVFCRGPGWAWYWPWQPWDPSRLPDLRVQNLADVFGIESHAGAFVLGAVVVLGWYALGWVGYAVLRRRRSATLAAMGPVRYAIAAFLLLTMLAIPLKIALRLALHVKYVWVTPWFNV